MAADTSRRAGRPYDPAARRKATRSGPERGCRVYRARLGHLAHPLLGVGRSTSEDRNRRRARTGVGKPSRA